MYISNRRRALHETLPVLANAGQCVLVGQRSAHAEFEWRLAVEHVPVGDEIKEATAGEFSERIDLDRLFRGGSGRERNPDFSCALNILF